MLCKIEENWLGGWKGILLGKSAYESKVERITDKFCGMIKASHGITLPSNMVQVRITFPDQKFDYIGRKRCYGNQGLVFRNGDSISFNI